MLCIVKMSVHTCLPHFLNESKMYTAVMMDSSYWKQTFYCNAVKINTIWFLFPLDASLSFGTFWYLWSVLAYLFFLPNVNWVWNQIKQYWNNSSVTWLLSCLTILGVVICLTEKTCWQHCLLNVCLHWQNKSCMHTFQYLQNK